MNIYHSREIISVTLRSNSLTTTAFVRKPWTKLRAALAGANTTKCRHSIRFRKQCRCQVKPWYPPAPPFMAPCTSLFLQLFTVRGRRPNFVCLVQTQRFHLLSAITSCRAWLLRSHLERWNASGLSASDPPVFSTRDVRVEKSSAQECIIKVKARWVPP